MNKERLKGKLIFLTLVVLLFSSCDEQCEFSGRWLGSMYFEQAQEGYKTRYLGLLLECGDGDYFYGTGYFASGSLSTPDDVWDTSYVHDADGEVLGDKVHIYLVYCWDNWFGDDYHEYYLNGYWDNNTLSGDVEFVQSLHTGSNLRWLGTFSVTRRPHK